MKGARGEREVAELFRLAGFKCDRTPNSGGLMIAGDLVGDVPVHVEVKRAERLKLPEWLAQAREEAPAGVTPVVAFRRNNEPWHAVVPLEAFVTLLSVARMVVGQVDGRPIARATIRDAIELHESRKGEV